MRPAIAIVGMACRYPDARSPSELWENALAQRRAFRRIPAERLNLNDYLSSDRQSPDQTYSTEGAFIEGYDFDRARFRVPGGTYRAADPAHWLTLNVAAAALQDAGFPEGEGLPRDATGVFVGNTLTGEFSRANTLRLRWPYVRRVVRKVLEEDSYSSERQRELLAQMEILYKKPFPPVNAETLAGGLSNTIAGRVCNHFNLKGGGYTVDGACASSLLAVINACSSLVLGDLEVALAGGVDLSTDPFELVGFAKMGALATDTMRVYDKRAAGFWPGEGCGLMVLMRHEDALLRGLRVYAVIRGWGVSSDGNGGITRPEVEGQLIALRRAYARAGYGADTVAYFEGHGTGTAVGDATELQALMRARHEAVANGTRMLPAAISSVKAVIGHTKAAAGIAGLIKATMALSAQILPPTVGCDEPHEELQQEDATLRTLKQGELFSTVTSLRAGVSAMGFGGINTHVTLEATRDDRRQSLTSKERTLLTSAQDAELFLFSAPDISQLENQIERVGAYAARLSRSELTDLAARLSETLRPLPFRAAVVASSATELSVRLEALRAHTQSDTLPLIDPHGGLFLGAEQSSARIAFLFPGQGSRSYRDGGIWRRRFSFLADLYAYTKQEWHGDGIATDVAQPAIVASSVAALRVLSRLGIAAAVAVGHSLGEFTALYWGGSMDESSLLRLARLRGRAMADIEGPTGAMLSVAANREAVEQILNGERVVIAGLNSPLQTVLSGEADEINAVARRAEARGLRTTLLRVSHAFHSSLVASVGSHLSAHLEREEFGPLKGQVFSTVTGRYLNANTNLRTLLCEQLTSPVRFMEAVEAAADKKVDLWLEVGPGQTLAGLIAEFRNEPAIALDAGGTSLRGLLSAVGAAFSLGAPVAHDELFADRFTRPFDLDWQPRFFVNPCELAPADDTSDDVSPAQSIGQSIELDTTDEVSAESQTDTPLEVVRRLVAERLELPIATIENESKLLDDLHLNSISVAQLVTEASRRLNLSPPPAPTDYANASLSEIAKALEAAARAGSQNALEAEADPPGVDEWVRGYSVALVERALPRHVNPTGSGAWRILAPPDHPLKDALQRSFAQSSAGRGVVVLIPIEPDESHVGLLLDGAREALKEGDNFCFVLVQHGTGAASFVRTLHLEARNLNTCVVDVPFDHPKACAWVLAEALTARGYVEAHYTSDGRRSEPVLRPLVLEADQYGLPLTTRDVLLVTGGARGITAECALSLTRESVARLAIFGLSQPTADGEIISNLERLKNAGIEFRYYSVDVTDATATRKAVAQVEEDLGPVTAILHGAARNVPCLIENLAADEFSKTLAPKIQGAQNLLAAIDPDKLRLFITFSSIIARTGLPGEAHYGLANEWLTRLTESWQTTHPHCRCLAVEWSVWSGVGMGARLGAVDELARRGIAPIPVEKGLNELRRLLCRKQGNVAAVVMGRLRDMPTLQVEKPELPFLRFLEKPRVYYAGVELVVDADLSTTTDPYLDDHVFRGERLLPAVMGMEAMAQVSMALMKTNEALAFEQVRFERPVIIGQDSTNTIRVAGLVRSPDRVDVVLRSSETGFQIDHFRAVCRIGVGTVESQPETISQKKDVIVDPHYDLYGGVLFHGGRFQRLHRYHALTSKQCCAEITADGTTSWFSRYLPGGLVLGDPGARDAAIHAVQACVPQTALLPVSVERITGSLKGHVGELFVHAQEREHFANDFIYDVTLIDNEGRVRERWERLHLRAISGADFQGPWPKGLLTPYVERSLWQLFPGVDVSVAFERDQMANHIDRRERSTRAIERALGATGIIRHTNGKPEAGNGRAVSASHSGDLTMAIAGHSPVGCDLEPVVARAPTTWRDLLGVERFKLAEIISLEAQETLDQAATRVWTATECLKKAGAGIAAPLVFTKVKPNRWILLSSGELEIASSVLRMKDEREELAIALLTGGENARV
ncbi:MAG TPA: SDR family NAD(P)-dependent oxidoreductase [Pyrinomonadaceae bacterium]|nr:SDR family NAD(P)-dependent oxidoreductase [Pyrinomonadaceae bacterium]